jgi:hypothetical protein
MQQPGQKQVLPQKTTKTNTGKIAAVISVVIVAVVILALMFFPFEGSDDPDKVKPEGYSFEMTDTDTMEYYSKINYTDEHASGTRNALDIMYGNNDGEVTSNEVIDCEEAMTENAVGDDSYGFEIDRQMGEYSHYSISFTGAEGDVTSEDPFTVEISATINWPNIDTDKKSYEIELSVSIIREDFEFEAPSGYKIFIIEGTSYESYEDGKSIVSGEISKFIMEITIVKTGGVQTTPQGSLMFTADPNVEGKYTGTFQGSVETLEINITIYDESLDRTVTMPKPENYDGVGAGTGLHIKYYDVNENEILDASDMIVIEYAEPGDMVSIVYRLNGNTITTATI